MSDDLPFRVDDRRKRGYFTIDNVLLDIYGKKLGPHGIAVYAALARFANQESACWPSYRTITERTGVSRSQIVRELAKLEALGIITVTPQIDDKGERKANLYTLLDIIGGGTTQEPGGSTSQVPPGTRVAPKQSLKKKDTPKDKKGGKKNYRPDEYADIILG